MPLYNYLGEQIFNEVATDKTLTQEDVPADAKVVGDALKNAGIGIIEPNIDDIPCVFIEGTTPTTKQAGELPVILTYTSKTDSFKAYSTLKVQGSSSTVYPKKNFTLKMYSDSNRTTKFKYNFRGWGKQSKFVLKANWIDITHARNIVSARLWGDMVKERSGLSQYPEAFRNAPNLGAIDGFVIKVFVNGIYQGRYTWNIPKDKWAFNMEVADDSAILCAGDLHQNAYFDKPTQITGGDYWEDKLHDDIGLPGMVTRFNNWINFVDSSSDSDFGNNLSSYAYVDSLIDYYIMLYVFCTVDNIGKNQIYVTYSGCPFIASAYDMDAIYDLDAYGNINSESNKNSPFPDDSWGHVNVLYTRLRTVFENDIKNRYAELREGALSTANIMSRYESFMRTQTESLIAEDYASTTAGGAYANIPSKTTNNIHQIRDYIVARMTYVDSVLLN